MNELTSILGIAAALLMGAVNLGPSLVMFARMVASEGRVGGIAAAVGMGALGIKLAASAGQP